MKEVVLLTTKYSEKKSDAWLTNELAYSLLEMGYSVSVVVFSWLKDDPESAIKNIDGVRVLRLKMPAPFYRFGFIGTAFKVFLFPYLARFYLSRHLRACDLVIANTPCITVNGLTGFLSRKFNSKSYLVLWDFFPYYLSDLGLVKNKYFFKILHYIENKMYCSFDKIGCMTPGNVDFLFGNYKGIDNDRVDTLHLWADQRLPRLKDKRAVRGKYGLPEDKVIAVYGGAMSVVQELDNILDLAVMASNINVVFLMVGRGTERDRLKEVSQDKGLNNVIFLDYVERDEYESLVAACDIGLISLSGKLTVPSFPSKSIDYFKVSIPVLASIDNVTDFGEIIERAGAGYFVTAGNTEVLMDKLHKLVTDSVLRERMGASARDYYESNFDVKVAADKIVSLI